MTPLADSTSLLFGSSYTDVLSHERSEPSETLKGPAVGLEEAKSLGVIMADGGGVVGSSRQSRSYSISKNGRVKLVVRI
jgi:hypothetical protein